NLFFGTTIPAAILLFNKGKKTKDVLFIDAGREYQSDKNQNLLRPEDMEKIVKTFKEFKTVDKYSYRATFKEIQENEFNLNIPRYVDTFEEEKVIDISAVQKDIIELENEISNVRKDMNKY